MKKAKKTSDFSPIHRAYLVREAKARGYTIPHSSKPGRIFKINNKKKTMIVLNDNTYPDISHYARRSMKDKFYTYQLLKKHAVNLPKTSIFHSVAEAMQLWKKEFKQKQVVLKPNQSTYGIDVYVQLSKIKEIKNAASKILKNHNGPGIIQSFCKGKDLRIQAVGGKLFAACIREPAHVVGDGKHTIKQLIIMKNKEIAIHNPKNKIQIDSETRKLLQEQKVSLQSIPKNNQNIMLKKIANIGQGGDPIDVTDKLHKSYTTFVPQLSKLFKAKIFAIDLIVKSPSAPIASKRNNILELNAPPEWAHHHFAVGQRRNVASAILDAYFYPRSFNPKAEKYLINESKR